MVVIPAIICLIAGYLIGSIMTAVKIAKSKSMDIRDCGSGNAGSTNVLRTFGWKWGIICLVCDCAKGALAVGLGHLIGFIWMKLDYALELESISNLFGCFAMLGAIFGHLLPVFYNFRGGKCVAVALGGLLVLAPLELLAAVAIAVILILITRMVSVGSVVGTLLAASFVIIANWGDIPLMVLSIIIATVIVAAHLPNIQRIMEGRERRLDRIEWERNAAQMENKEDTFSSAEASSEVQSVDEAGTLSKVGNANEAAASQS
ncbi:MAG: glycerol-3-phosphate 1-O-acyltransferase PlsY [Christensenellaceae bacterium]|nr:glycerol-3-phosphate 1-O-acyltransferase PlsY [Christensenellaceae bacterium]